METFATPLFAPGRCPWSVSDVPLARPLHCGCPLVALLGLPARQRLVKSGFVAGRLPPGFAAGGPSSSGSSD